MQLDGPMDLLISREEYKTGGTKPCHHTLWRAFLVTSMFVAIGLMVVLPPYLSRDSYYPLDDRPTQSTHTHNDYSEEDRRGHPEHMTLETGNGQVEEPSATIKSQTGNNGQVEEPSATIKSQTGNEKVGENPGTTKSLTDNGHVGESIGTTKPQTGNERVREPPGTITLQTGNGRVRGLLTNGVRVFHGVPYALPPVGPLRWQPPQQTKPWTPNVYDATFKRDGCPQYCYWQQLCPQTTSEDCLYLEIFSPLTASAPNLLPVLVYIHGGSFSEMSATSSAYDSVYLAKRTGVVVVLVEYRLGALGFLTLSGKDRGTTPTDNGGNKYNDEDDVLGNFGLLDQTMALRWVHENVKSFGGDPDKVTLAGQSAGSQSIILHLQSQVTSQYFRSAILESPPVTFPFKTVDEALKQSRQFAKLTHCSALHSDSGLDLDLACLGRLDTATILKAQGRVKPSSYLKKVEPWGPVVGGKFNLLQPIDAFNSTPYSFHKPILWGVTAEEALLFVRTFFKNPTGKFTYLFAKSILNKGIDSHRFASLYPSTKPSDSRDDIALLTTDFVFRCPLQWASHNLHDAGIDNLWTYVWDKSLIFSEYDFGYMCSNRSCHGVEIPYVFHTLDGLGAKLTDKDYRLSDVLIDYYGNFVKYLDPNGIQGHDIKDEANLPLWPKSYVSGEYRTLRFQKNGEISIEDGVSEERCQLWIDKGFKL